jgi:arylsulfatase A-like enzyme
MGFPAAKTPNFDRLAARSVTFSRAYTAAPWCNPSRTALLTGLRPGTTGVYSHWDDHWRTSPRLTNQETLPQYF